MDERPELANTPPLMTFTEFGIDMCLRFEQVLNASSFIVLTDDGMLASFSHLYPAKEYGLTLSRVDGNSRVSISSPFKYILAPDQRGLDPCVLIPILHQASRSDISIRSNAGILLVVPDPNKCRGIEATFGETVRVFRFPPIRGYDVEIVLPRYKFSMLR